MREKPAKEHIEELMLHCSESLFTKIMYKHRSHYTPGEEKPELSAGCPQIRVDLAELLLSMDLKTIAFIDEANMRSEYGKIHVWHTPEERFHPDVKQSTTKQDYSKGEFMGALKWGEPPGPYRLFSTETLEEKKEAEILLKKYQSEQEPQLRAEFDAREAEKDVCNYPPVIPFLPLQSRANQAHSQRLRGNRSRRGAKASFEVYKKKHRITRGDRAKGGIDWFRFTDKYVQPLLKPWIEELQAKEDQRRGTRTYKGVIWLAADNAGAHKSKYTASVLRLLNITRLIWPLQSPDLNPIEHAWDYIRQQIRKREHRPITEEEIFKAWEEEWLAIPQERINFWVENLEDMLRKVVANRGDNCFYG